MPGGEMHYRELAIVDHSKAFQDDLQKLGLKIKHHEDNLAFLKKEINKLGECILDAQVSLGNYQGSNARENGPQNANHLQSEQNTIEQIQQQEKTAAAVLCQLKIRHGNQVANLKTTQDVLGVVAMLGKVQDDNLSRLLSEYLGLETMLAMVCKTYEGLKALELYDLEGKINKGAGLHGLGHSLLKTVDGRFRVICLEELRPYVGEIIAEDPQKKLALLKPRLPCGELPQGFLGFAVNMIYIDNKNLSCLTSSGHGLRETLFYSLFSRLQIYNTRTNMQQALPCISDGALSLDGGMIRDPGVFCLGDRKDVPVRFPLGSGMSNLPVYVIELEEKKRFMEWEKERISEDLQREEALLHHSRNMFEIKKQEMVKFLAQASPQVVHDKRNEAGC